MEKYVKLSTILVFVSMIAVGFSSYGVINSLAQQEQEQAVVANGTVVIPEGGTIDVYDKSFESILGLIIAIVSLIATYLVRTNANKKYIDNVYQARDIVEMIRQDRETRREGMQAVYDMLPQQAQEIVDKPRVRVENLTRDIGAAEQRVNALNSVIDRFGKPKI